eukprot:TRINITY_DN9498_c0_g2_i3.p1 TRINITY_DN9498_c0_g2~~TRINITY_DN9498_c0_g2_i3.p1  ORF type:complete len:312 (+),score=62.01 TRINITY_DN9498_c0_g2_i3:206-1141(+)
MKNHVLKQQKLRERLSRPSTFLILYTISLIPAFIVLIVQAASDEWLDSTKCKFDLVQLLAFFYVLFWALCCAWLYSKLKAARENFGIKATYARTMVGVVSLVVIWFVVANVDRKHPPIEALIPATLSSAIWPLFGVYVPLYEEYRNWSPSDALLLDGVTRQPLFLSSRHHGVTHSRATSIARPEISLANILEDKLLLEEFILFLKAEFSVENFFFLKAVQAYRAAPSHESALELIGRYILDSAPLQVNMSDHVRKRLLDFAQSNDGVVLARPGEIDLEIGPDAELFASAEAEIIRLLEFDSLRRFALLKDI